MHSVVLFRLLTGVPSLESLTAFNAIQKIALGLGEEARRGGQGIGLPNNQAGGAGHQDRVRAVGCGWGVGKPCCQGAHVHPDDSAVGHVVLREHIGCFRNERKE